MMLTPVGNFAASRLKSAGNASPEAQAVRVPRRHKRWGATTVELAVVSPIVFTIILGVFEFSRGLMVIHLLNNAAQAGCRTGIIEGKSTANIKKVVGDTLTATGVSGDAITVQVNDGNADASSAAAGDEITVKVSVPVSSITWLPTTLFLSGSLQGQYTMRRE
jgi:Flp pilus assembly protein TadG